MVKWIPFADGRKLSSILIHLQPWSSWFYMQLECLIVRFFISQSYYFHFFCIMARNSFWENPLPTIYKDLDLIFISCNDDPLGCYLCNNQNPVHVCFSATTTGFLFQRWNIYLRCLCKWAILPESCTWKREVIDNQGISFGPVKRPRGI